MGHRDDEVLSTPMTILGMVNGMIGGLILILPVYALHAGYILTMIIIFVTCVFSYYSCYLCIIHLGDQSDLDYAILRHFNGSKWAKIFYDLCVWSNLMLIALLYFQLIMIQWQGLIPPHQFTFINPLVNTFVLLAFVFILKYFQFGASIMAYGIISIISYLIFLIWVVATYNQGNDSVDYKPFGTGAVNLAAAMGQAFSIQSFFIPVLKKNPNEKKYVLYTLIAYIIGGFAYYYIGYMGSVGIWHREYNNEPGNQTTIEGYFGNGTWQVNIVQAIYLIHLYSVFPEFTIIIRRRMFHVLGLKESDRGRIKLSEVIYFGLVVAVCFVVAIFRININDIIDINGAVIGFFFIYLMPAALHIKCLYFSRGKKSMPEDSSISLEKEENNTGRPTNKGEIEFTERQAKKGQQDDNQQSKGAEIEKPLMNESSEPNKEVETKEMQHSETPVNEKGDDQSRTSQSVAESRVDYSTFCCGVHLQTYSKKALVLDWIMIVVMVGLGVFIMVNGIYTVATGH